TKCSFSSRAKKSASCGICSKSFVVIAPVPEPSSTTVLERVRFALSVNTFATSSEQQEMAPVLLIFRINRSTRSSTNANLAYDNIVLYQIHQENAPYPKQKIKENRSFGQLKLSLHC